MASAEGRNLFGTMDRKTGEELAARPSLCDALGDELSGLSGKGTLYCWSISGEYRA